MKLSSTETVLVVGIGDKFNWTNKQTGEVLAMKNIHLIKPSTDKKFHGYNAENFMLFGKVAEDFDANQKGMGFYHCTFECEPRDNKPAKIGISGLVFKKEFKFPSMDV